VVPDLRLEAVAVGGVHVGRVADHEVRVEPGHGLEELALVEGHPPVEPEPPCVLAGHVEGRPRDVGRVDLGVLPLGGDREGDAARARADVDDPRSLRPRISSRAVSTSSSVSGRGMSTPG
jgi:hypothetical protein